VRDAVLLYDLTSTYFESDPPTDEADKRRHGYTREKRSDCVQVVIALIVTPEGFPLAYEVLPGNTADSATLRAFLREIEAQYGKAEHIWVMDRGIPTEEALAEMRQADPPVSYLVGTPKGRLGKLEQALIGLPWQEVRDGVEVKLLPQDPDLYVLAQSRARIHKKRAMRRRQLKRLWGRLGQLAAMRLKREDLLMKLGAARAKAPAAWRLLDIAIDPKHQPSPKTLSGRPGTSTFSRLAQRSLALRPAHSRRHQYVTCYTEGFSHFVTSVTAPVASGWSGCRVGLAPTGKRRLVTGGRCGSQPSTSQLGILKLWTHPNCRSRQGQRAKTASIRSRNHGAVSRVRRSLSFGARASAAPRGNRRGTISRPAMLASPQPEAAEAEHSSHEERPCAGFGDCLHGLRRERACHGVESGEVQSRHVVGEADILQDASAIEFRAKLTAVGQAEEGVEVQEAGGDELVRIRAGIVRPIFRVVFGCGSFRP